MVTLLQLYVYGKAMKRTFANVMSIVFLQLQRVGSVGVTENWLSSLYFNHAEMLLLLHEFVDL